MATTKKAAPAADTINNTGAHIEHVTISNNAAPVSDKAADALAELARASAAHARALSDIAQALRGAEARMEHGIHLSHLCGTP